VGTGKSAGRKDKLRKEFLYEENRMGGRAVNPIGLTQKRNCVRAESNMFFSV